MNRTVLRMSLFFKLSMQGSHRVGYTVTAFFLSFNSFHIRLSLCLSSSERIASPQYCIFHSSFKVAAQNHHLPVLIRCTSSISFSVGGPFFNPLLTLPIRATIHQNLVFLASFRV